MVRVCATGEAQNTYKARPFFSRTFEKVLYTLVKYSIIPYNISKVLLIEDNQVAANWGESGSYNELFCYLFWQIFRLCKGRITKCFRFRVLKVSSRYGKSYHDFFFIVGEFGRYGTTRISTTVNLAILTKSVKIGSIRYQFCHLTKVKSLKYVHRLKRRNFLS